MCHWMGSHFHDWIDYYMVAFSVQFLERSRTLLGFGGLGLFWQVDIGILGNVCW